MQAAASLSKVWSDNLGSELSFWRSKLSERGTPSAERVRQRLSDRPLPGFVTRAIPAKVGEEVRVLDVGSGPLTTLGNLWEGYRVRVYAVDPLADDYNVLMDELGLVPPVRPIKGLAERLTDLFEEGTFDFAHACNALDHSADPAEAVRQMLRILKPGRIMRLNHSIDEGEHARYHGLHQWNFAPAGGDMRIWNREASYLLSELAPGCDIRIETDGKMVTATVVKSRA